VKSESDTLGPEMLTDDSVPFFCSICTQPISLMTDKVSSEGRPMHESCFLDKLARKRIPWDLSELEPYGVGRDGDKLGI
jgi:hypothetical protein